MSELVLEENKETREQKLKMDKCEVILSTQFTSSVLARLGIVLIQQVVLANAQLYLHL